MTRPAPEPRPGAWSPWGAVQHVEPLADGVVFVSTASHGGAWLREAAQARIPAAIAPMHGRTWFEEDCEIWAPLLVFGVHDAENDRGRAVAVLARWKPDWLEALAEPCGVPTAAQVATIRRLWADFRIDGELDLAAFPREAGTGFVHGWIGTRLFVEIKPDGRAHS